MSQEAKPTMRLRHVLRAVGPAGHSVMAPLAAQQDKPPPASGGKPLTSEQLNSFVMDGFLVVNPCELGKHFHADIYQRACDAAGWHVGGGAPAGGTPAGGLPAQNLGTVKKKGLAWQDIPEISTLVESFTVKGALTSILGDDCVMHPHSEGANHWQYVGPCFLHVVNATAVRRSAAHLEFEAGSVIPQGWAPYPCS